MIRLNTVVLPAPLGPTIDMTWPRRNREAHAVDRDQPAEALG